MRADMKRPDLGRTPPAGDVPTRLPFFRGNLFHDLDLEVALRKELLESSILLLEFLEAFDVRDLHAAERPAPLVNRLRAHAVLLGDRCHRAPLGFRSIFTFCSSLNRLFLMLSPDGPEEAVCHVLRGPKFRGQVRSH
jgi:hypothetical protein